MVDIIDYAGGWRLPDGVDRTGTALGNGEVHPRVLGPIGGEASADIVARVGSQAALSVRPSEMEDVNLFGAQRGNVQGIVDGAQRIWEARGGDIAQPPGRHDDGARRSGERSRRRWENLRARARNVTSGLRGTGTDQRGGQGGTPRHDFPHCDIYCVTDAADGDPWIKFACRRGMHHHCWNDYSRHPLGQRGGLPECPVCGVGNGHRSALGRIVLECPLGGRCIGPFGRCP